MVKGLSPSAEQSSVISSPFLTLLDVNFPLNFAGTKNNKINLFVKGKKRGIQLRAGLQNIQNNRPTTFNEIILVSAFPIPLSATHLYSP